ncbi:MAG: penicillin-binding protein 1C [Burkholderiales bacterium]|nr:penicillin-binding protein 1C [Burkholderiales bacterium]
MTLKHTVLALCCLLLGGLAQPAASAPTFGDVRGQFQSSEARLLARDGRVLHELRMDKRVRRIEWVPLTEVSPAFIDALILSEDQRFFQHKGVDWTAMLSAAWDNLNAPAGKRPRGASTLTMQLAGLMREDLAPRVEGRTVAQKWDQVGAARELERSWSKAEILEAYLNLVTYRGELQGIAAASRGLFGKHPGGLDRDESLLLAAMLRSPNAKPNAVVQRACALRAKVEAASNCDNLKLEADAALKRIANIRSEYSQAPHLARKLLEKSSTYVRTTLDADIQRTAIAAVQRHLIELSGRNVEDAAVLVLDNATGDVLAWVGSSGALSAAGEIDGVTALRQAGSTLKPFLYGQAIEQRLITAASVIDDAPLNIDTSIGVYTPGNYDGGYKGLVSARVALAGSLNVPAVKMLQRVGPEAFRKKLISFGIDSLTEDGDWYGYSLALGSGDVSLMGLTNAYRTLANGGQWTPVRVKAEEPVLLKPRRAMDAAAFIVADMLADNSARAITFGTDSTLATRPWTAVKTGTSKDMRDNWCIGFSGRYTVGVWVGNFSGAPMRDVSGVAGAAPIWADLMHVLHADVRSQPPERVAGLVSEAIAYEPAVEPPRREWFIAGTEQANIRIREQAAVSSRIVYPTPGLIVAIDPDIPAAYQKLPIELTLPEQVVGMTLNDAPLTVAARQYWSPQRGRHTLALRDAEGRTVAEVRFEVR